MVFWHINYFCLFLLSLSGLCNAGFSSQEILAPWLQRTMDAFMLVYFVLSQPVHYPVFRHRRTSSSSFLHLPFGPFARFASALS